MRLIDGDELKTAFPYGEMVRTECVRATIDHMPTIEERKKGEWKIINLGAVGVFDSCSECERVVKHKAPFYNFCPHCGADMRGEEE